MPKLETMLAAWRQAVSFMNRDVKSFLPSLLVSNEQVEGRIDQPVDTALPLLEPLIDPRKLSVIATRRAILDWRDQSIVAIERSAKNSLNQFEERVAGMLNDVPIWRQIVAQSASTVLRSDFDKMVRAAIKESARQAHSVIDPSLPLRSDEFATAYYHRDFWVDSDLSCLADLSFKPTKSEAIFAACRNLVLGREGIAFAYQNQVISIAKQQIEELSCADADSV